MAHAGITDLVDEAPSLSVAHSQMATQDGILVPCKECGRAVDSRHAPAAAILIGLTNY